MNAVRLHALGDLRPHEEPAPRPAAGELLLAVDAVGLCGSDRHWFDEGAIGDSSLERPLVLGHELSATVAAGPRAGQRVAVDPAIPCGVCTGCRRGDSHLCPVGRFAGHAGTDGGLQQLLAWPKELCHPLPDAIPSDEAALLEPLGVALHALDLGAVQAGSRVGVFGCGPIGLLLTQLLNMVGVGTLLTADPREHRRAAAAGLGATAVACGDPALPAAELDIAFEVAGVDAALADALASIRPGGRVVAIGIPAADRTSFSASLARRKGATILLSRRMRASDLPRAIGLAADGAVRLGGMVTGRYPLAEATAAFRDLEDFRGIKTIVEPQRREESR